jgi:hypothetical protein
MQQGVVGAWTGFKASVENLVQTIARSGVLQTVTDTLNSLASGINRLSEAHPAILRFATYGAMIAAVVAPLGFVLSGIARFAQVMMGFGAWMAGAGVAGTAGTAGVGVGTAALGAGAAGAGLGRMAIARGMIGRLGLLGAAWLGADAGWRLIGGHDAIARMFAPPAPGTPEAAQRERMERLRATLDARHTATTAADAVDPAMLAPSTPTPSLSELLGRQDTSAATGAAAATMGAYSAAVDRGFDELMATARRRMAEFEAMLEARGLSVTITPRIDMSGVNGIHADVGTGPR